MTELKKLLFPLAACAAILAAAPLSAQEPAARPDHDPRGRPNDSWISLSGEVRSVLPGSFVLDYGEGMVTVEMDDGDRDADAYQLLAGDQVTVHGFLDADLYERRKIEAGGVYVEKLGTWFRASFVDEEDLRWFPNNRPAPRAVIVQGAVTGVDERGFTIDTGARRLRVDVTQMPYDPLDGEGYQQIAVGHRVSVAGTLRSDLFERRELRASSIVTLAN